MFYNIAEAIENQDYQIAQQLIDQIQKEEPENPWLLLYQARLEEATEQIEKATQNYQELLLQCPNPKIVSQARQGINRITQKKKALRQETLAQINTQAANLDPAVLILEPIATDLKPILAAKFAQIMDIDPYTARLQLPSRAWRLYRTGKIGEMRYYTDLLTKADIPCFCAAITEIKQIQVYQIDYFQSVSQEATVVYQSQNGQETLTFDWSEISQTVEGLIPIFEECVDTDVKRKLQRKTKTLDYTQVCDLHLKTRQSIIRLWDQNYKFQKGVAFWPQQQNKEAKTTRDNWNQLTQYLKRQLIDQPVWSDFTPFAETAIDYQETLKLIEPHINLLRREETPWDAAFQLYSSLVFVRQ